MLLCQCFTPSLVVTRYHVLELSSGKRTAWDTWSAYDEVTPAFCALAATTETAGNWLCPLERFVVLLYDCTNSPEFVNGMRKQFTQKGRVIVLRHKQYFSSRIRRSTKVKCQIFHNTDIGCPHTHILTNKLLL